MTLYRIFMSKHSNYFYLYGITDSIEKANKLCLKYLESRLVFAKGADESMYERELEYEIKEMKRKRKAWTECGQFKIIEFQSDVLYDVNIADMQFIDDNQPEIKL